MPVQIPFTRAREVLSSGGILKVEGAMLVSQMSYGAMEYVVFVFSGLNAH